MIQSHSILYVHKGNVGMGFVGARIYVLGVLQPRAYNVAVWGAHARTGALWIGAAHRVLQDRQYRGITIHPSK